MFDTVLVANRGEIAVRIMRTLRALGIRCIAVYSDADRDARHVREADRAIRIGPARASESYLSISNIIAAARSCGAQAIHPGYGFLSENADFARACTSDGIVFIGPPVAAIEAMGDKIVAKSTVGSAGVPVVPGFPVGSMSTKDVSAAAEEVGYPVLVKPSAGGGGKGMRLVHFPEETEDALAGARREAAAAFGNDALLVEKYIDSPRHIEIQIVADAHGNVIHLGERECSLQRRHQKIIEEAPSPLLDSAQRAVMGVAAVNAARSVGYVGLGTVEFIVNGSDPSQFYFLEMNTRLQVEHPVTEMVTGLDLVEMQVRIAAGERLPFTQVRLRGHAIEARVYAEDPTRDFLPSAGVIHKVTEPSGPHVRIDSGIEDGTVVGTDYDPMLAKVIAWGSTRATALRVLNQALGDTAVLGVQTNTALLRRLLSDPDVVIGRLDTGLVERRLEMLGTDRPPLAVFAAAALLRQQALIPQNADPFQRFAGWRIGEHAWTRWPVQVSGSDPIEVRIRGTEVVVGDEPSATARLRVENDEVWLEYAGRSHHFVLARHDDRLWLGRDGAVWEVRARERSENAAEEASAGDGRVRAPMPGTIAAVHASNGDTVEAGAPLVVVEAMKMEHVLTAPFAGQVAELHAQIGQTVAIDDVLAVVQVS